MDESNSPQSDYLLPGRVYDILKWLALIALPAVAWLVGAVGPQWGLPHCGELVTTINAIGLFVGAEGGFSPEEIRLFKQSGIPAVSLGATVLRMETAAIVFPALVIHHLSQSLCLK